MPSIVKPTATHPSLQRNALGLTIRDYEGSMSTLCAGCGHDSISAALIQACFDRRFGKPAATPVSSRLVQSPRLAPAPPGEAGSERSVEG